MVRIAVITHECSRDEQWAPPGREGTDDHRIGCTEDI
jgi:hypothetical protein